MSLPVVFVPEARAEFDEAADWYEIQNPGLGTDFIGHVDLVLDGISAMPCMHQVIYKDVRRAIVKKYPYTFFYQIETDHILIIAIFHVKREPSIWQERVP